LSNLGDMDDLQADLKKAAAAKLGTNLSDVQSSDDLAVSQSSANIFAAALAESRRKLEERKLEIGEEAALAELDESIRKTSAPEDGDTETRAWMVDGE